MCDINKLFLVKKGKGGELRTPKKSYDIRVKINSPKNPQVRIGISHEAWRRMDEPEKILCGFDMVNPNRLYFFPNHENGHKVVKNSGAKKKNTERYICISVSLFNGFAERFIGEANLERDSDNNFYIVNENKKGGLNNETV